VETAFPITLQTITAYRLLSSPQKNILLKFDDRNLLKTVGILANGIHSVK
jgi:hypothetical protein